jgi:hypothetical protein
MSKQNYPLHPMTNHWAELQPDERAAVKAVAQFHIDAVHLLQTVPAIGSRRPRTSLVDGGRYQTQSQQRPPWGICVSHGRASSASRMASSTGCGRLGRILRSENRGDFRDAPACSED